MSNLGSSEVDQRLAEQWGKLGQSSAESKASIEDLVNQYKKAPLWAFNRNQGEATYKKLCSNCHSQTDQSQRIGPKLEGSGTKGIEYIVENIIDPNAVIGEDFLARQILTVDGTVVTGVVLKESETALTVRTATSTQIIAKDDVDQIVISKNSFMPEGILKPLSDRERIELLMYVMSM
jgi:putative heme-binding domain-containing protein